MRGVIAVLILALPGVALAQGRAEVSVTCSVQVRPLLIDPETRVRVPADADRFILRAVGESATVAATGDGWTVTSGRVRIEYELVDRLDGAVVLRDTVELSCGRPRGASHDVIDLVSRRVFRGATMTRTSDDDHGSCGGDEGPEQWYRLRLDAPSRVGLHLVSEFDATVYIREGSIDGPEIRCLDHAARLEHLTLNLPAGDYYVAVDGTGTHGRYRLVAFADPIDPRATASVPLAEVAPDELVFGELVPALSGYHASCGGHLAPEHVYAFRLDRPSFVAVRLTSRFDPALYLLAADGQELACRSVLGPAQRARRSRLTQELPAGLYYVVVDGESQDGGTGRYQLSLAQLPL